MLSFAEYRAHDALGLAELVRQGQITPAELLETAIRRVEEVNPALNAVVHKLYDSAREAAKNVPPDAPFAGVPLLVKDLGMEIAGTPMCTGSRGYRDYKSEHDSFAVGKLRHAGFVFFGKTNTSASRPLWSPSCSARRKTPGTPRTPPAAPAVAPAPPWRQA